MSRDTTTPKYDIKFNPDVLRNYGLSEYPRFSICLYLNKQEGEDDYEEENIAYFPADEKDMLVEYINENLQDELEEFTNIYRITINWESLCGIGCIEAEEIDTIYENEIWK
mgnify:FL=1|tara:strand:- start:619 stop:951 length:333 start_codon:yes stop_codon:yes gene_type:complete